MKGKILLLVLFSCMWVRGLGQTIINVDLSGSVNVTDTLTGITRSGSYCHDDNCVVFVVTLNPGTDLLSMVPLKKMGSAFYTVNCGPQTPVGKNVCVSGLPSPIYVSFCKPGSDNNIDYAITASTAVKASPDITVRQGCTGSMSVTGLDSTSVIWTSIAQGSAPQGAYDTYLDCPKCTTTNVKPPISVNTPAYIDYQVRGIITSCSSYKMDTVRVYTVTPMTVAVSPTTAAICGGVGGNVILTATASGGSPPYTYVWTNSSGVSVGTTQSITVSTADTYTVNVSDNITGCGPIPQSVTVTAGPIPAAPTAAGTTICSGSSTTLTATAPGGTYQWYDAATGGTLLATGATFNTPALTTTTTYYVQATSAAGCTGSRTAVTVTVNPIPAAPTAAGMTICSGTSTMLTATAPGGGSFQWYTTSSGGTPISTTATYATPVLTATTTYYVETTVGGCTGPRTPVVVTVNPIPAAPTAPGTTICAGSVASLTATAPSGATFQWYDAASGGNLLATGATYVTPALTITTTYYVQATIGGCTGARTAVTVTVNPIPPAPTAPGTTICSGSSTILTATAPGGGTFQWYTVPSGGTPVSTTATYTTPALTTTTTYYVETTVNGCTGPRAQVTVSVNPIPPAPTAAGTTICNGGSTTLTATAPGGGSFQWYTASSGGTPVATTAAYVTPTLTTTTTYYVETTVGGCTGARTPVVVTVNPIPHVTVAGPPSICSGTALNAALSSDVSGATFSWTRAAASGINDGTGTTQSGNAINETLTNTTALPINVQYTIVASIGACPGPSVTYTVTVNPTPHVTGTGPASICNGTTPNYTLASDVSGVTFVWTRPAINNINNGAAASQSGSIINEVLTNTSTAPINVTYTITPSSATCSGPQLQYTVTVNPTPIINSGSSASTCNNTALKYVITSNVSGATFTWIRAADPGINDGAGTTQSTGTINEALNNTTSAPIDVKYTITATANGCSGPPFTYTLKVFPTPTVTSPLTGSICNNTSPNYTITGGVSGTVFIWSRAYVQGISNSEVTIQTGNLLNEVLNNTTSAPIDVKYNILPYANGCYGPQYTYTVTVNPIPAVTSVPSATICNNTSPNYTILSNVSGATFSWTRAAATGINDGTGTSQSGNTISETLTNNTSAPIDVKYTIVPAIGGCSGAPFTYTVTVNPTPKVTSASSSGPICNNTSANYTILSNVAGATFTWTRAADPGINDGTGTTQSGSTITETLTNTTSAPIDVKYTIVPGIGSCSGPSFTYTVTVNPTAKVTSPSTSSAPICNNTSPNYTITSDVTGATFTWTRAADPGINDGTGTTQTGNAITETLTNNTSAPIDVKYTIIPSIGSCNGTSFTYTVTVNPTPKVTSAASSGPICNNTSANYTILSNVAGATFSWSRAADPGINDGTGTSQSGNTISETLTNTTSAPINVKYTIIPGIGSCSGPSFTYTVTVEPTAKVTSPSTSSAPICNNTSPNYTITSDVTGATFIWSRAADPGINDGTGTTQSGGFIGETLTNTTSAPIAVKYTIVPSIGSCSGTSFTYTVTVEPTAKITSAASTGPICNSTALNYTIMSNVAGATFTWTRAADPGINNGTGTSQAGNTITETLTNTTSAPIDVKYTIVPSIGLCNGTSFTYTVTVNPTPKVTSAASSGPICSNTSPNYTILSDVAGATFSWTRAADPGINDGTGTTQSGSSITEILTNTTSAPIAVKYTIIPSIGGCSGTSFTYTVTVNPTPKVTSASSSGPICNSTALNYTITSDVSGATFTWSREAVQGINNPEVVLQSGNTITETLVNITSAPIDVQYTIVPSIGNCAGITFTYTVTVNPTAKITSPSTSSAPICNNTSPNYTITSDVTGATFSWTRAANPGINNGTGTSQSGNTISEILTNNTSAPIDVKYTIVPSIGNCSGTSFTYTVTVNPTPKVTSAASTGPICNSTALNYTITSDVSGATFSWTRSANPGINDGTGTTQSGGFIGETLTNTTSAPIAVKYTIVPSIGNCSGTSFTYTVTVNPTPKVTSAASTGPICNSTALNYTITSDVAGATFTWTRAADPGINNGTGTSQTGNTITETLTNTTSAPIDVKYTIVPSIGSCNGTAFTYTVTVNPTAKITSPSTSSAPICNNTSPNYTITSDVTGATFTWTRAADPGINDGTGTSQSGNTISETLTNTTSAPIAVKYTIVPSIGSCSGTSFTYTVTVNPTPKVTSAASSGLICNSTALNYTITSDVSGATFTWSRKAVQGINNPEVALQSGNTITETLTNTTSAPIDVQYIIVPAIGNCSGTSFTYTVTVNPTAKITSPSTSSAPICNNTSPNYTITSDVTGATFSWTRAANPGINNGTGTSQSGNTISEILTNNTSAPIDVKYTIVPSIGNCSGTSFTYTVTVNPTPKVTSAASSGPICNTTALNYTITSDVSGATFTWSRDLVQGISNDPVANQPGNTITETLVNTTSAPIDVKYTITPSIGNCAGITFTYTVTVNPTAKITSPSTSSAPICNNTSPNYTITSDVAGATFIWSRAAVNGISNGAVTQTGNTIGETLTNTTSAPIDVKYIIVPSIGSCSGTSFTYTVTVNPTPKVTSAASSGPICNSTALNYTITSDVTGATFTWTRPAVNGINDGTGTTQPGNTISETLTNTTSAPIDVKYTIIPAIGNCSGTPFTYTVTVNPTAKVMSASTSSAPICNNTSPNYTIMSDVAGATFIWSRDLIPGISNGAVTQTGNLISEILTNTTSAPIDVKYTIVPAIGNCSGTSFTYTVTVNPTPKVTSAASTGPICNSTALNYTITSDVAGATFTWTRAAVNGISNGTITQTGNTITETLTNTTSAPIDVKYTIVPSIGSCNGTTFTYTVTVNPTAKITSPSTSSAPICNNTSPNYTITSDVTGATFTWTRSADPGINDGTGTTQSGNIIAETLTNTTSAPIAVKYTIVPSTGSCSGTSFTYTVTVNPTPKVTSAASSGPICNSTALNYTITSDVSGATFTWSRKAVQGISNPAVALQTGNIINETLTNTTTTPIDVQYTIIPATGSCSGTSFTYTVTVNPTPHITSPSSSAPICNNTALNYTITSDVAGATFTWTRLAIPGISNPGVTNQSGNTITEILTNTTSAPITVTYNIIPTANGCMGAGSFTYKVIVQPTPIVTNSSLAQIVCSQSSSAPVILQSNVSGTTFQWTAVASPGIAGFVPGGTGNIPAKILLNADTVAGTVTYTVTPYYNGCSGNPVNYVITVNPKPATPVAASNSPVCQNSPLTLTTAAVNGATYSWIGPNGFISDQQNPVIASAGLPAAGTYTLFVTVNGCTSDAGTTKVAVIPTPTAPVAGSNGPLCQGSTLLLKASSIAGATYSWTGPKGFTSNLQNPAIDSVTTANAGIYKVIAMVNGCPSPADSVSVVINEIPVAPTATSNSPVCKGTVLTLSVKTVPGYTYTWTGPNGFTSNQANPIISAATLANAGTYYVTATSGGLCTGPAQAVNVVVDETPINPVASSNSPVCTGNPITLSASSFTGALYKWSGPNGYTSNLQNPVIDVAGLGCAGVYTVSITAPGCSVTTTASTSVVVNQTPIAPTASSNSPVCVASDIKLSAAGVAGASYLWTGPNGFTSTLQNPVIHNAALTDSGTYKVIVIVNACTSAATSTKVVMNRPEIAFAGNNQVTCANNANITLAGTITGDNHKGIWTTSGSGRFLPADTSLKAIYVPSAADIAAGSVSLTLSSTQNGGCNVSASTLKVTINPTPIVNAGGNRVMCVYDPAININGSVKYAANGRWTTSGTGTFSPSNTALNVNYIPSATDRSAGSVRLTLTSLDNSNCFPVSDAMNLTILPSTNISMPNLLYIKQGDSKVLEPVVTGSAVEYSWSPGLYLSSPAVKTPTVKGVESQLYTLTVTGVAGCAVSKQIQINVLKPVVVPNTFTPNGDGINDVWVIKELANYPGAEVSIYNRYGMKMFFSRGYGVPWDGTYGGKPVPFGTYYYVISLGIYGAPMSGYVAVVR